METEIEKQVQQDIALGWMAVKRLNADLPGFAEYIHHRFPSDWAEMKETWLQNGLSKIELDIHVHATIQHPGFFGETFVDSEGKGGR